MTVFFLFVYVEPLLEKITVLVSELTSMLKGHHGNDILDHVLSVLSTLVSNHPRAVEECRKPELRLEEVLRGKLQEQLQEYEVS